MFIAMKLALKLLHVRIENIRLRESNYKLIEENQTLKSNVTQFRELLNLDYVPRDRWELRKLIHNSLKALKEQE